MGVDQRDAYTGLGLGETQIRNFDSPHGLVRSQRLRDRQVQGNHQSRPLPSQHSLRNTAAKPVAVACRHGTNRALFASDISAPEPAVRAQSAGLDEILGMGVRR